MKTVILIPCYNEAKTIQKVVDDFKSILPHAYIYVYDNNSTDHTDEIARSSGAVVRYERKQGKGNVMRRMFREIDARCYVLVDGDDTYPADSAREMCNLVLQENADMVVGDRLSSTYFQENKRPFHNFGNSLVRDTINRIFHSEIKDIMTGYRAMSFEFVKTFPVLSGGFEIETEMTIHAVDKGLDVRNVIVDYRDRPAGSVSKLNTYKDGMKVLGKIIDLYKDYRPASFFGWIALILILIGTVFFIPVLRDYMHTGLVAKFPTLIVCGFVVMAGILSFFAGRILQASVDNERARFELSLHEAHYRRSRLEQRDRGERK